MERVQKVLANCEQGLSTAEKAQARRNIDAQMTLTAGNNISISASGVISATSSQQVQSNWNETDSSADSYIQNKPNVPSIVKTTATLPPVDTNINTLKVMTNGRVLGDSSELGLLAPTGSQADAGKVLTLHYSGSPGTTTARWDTPTAGAEVATVTHGQAGEIETPVQKLVIDEDFGQLVADNRTVGLVAPVPQSTDNGKLVAVNGDLLEYVDAPNVAFVTTDDSYQTVESYRSQGYEVILTVDPGTDLRQYFRLVQKNPDGSMEFSCLRPGSGFISGYSYHLQTNSVWTRTDTAVHNYTGILINGIGRNLHLNQNNYVQTNIPGGIWEAPTSANNIFTALSGANFAGAYRLLCRHNTNETYELALSYTASGMSSTITFIGTETVIGTDNTVTVNQAAYIGETTYYTPPHRFGYSSSTIFNPTQHKAIYYSGVAQIGPTSDTKIAIWDDNGTIKISFTSIEVGKIGSTN